MKNNRRNIITPNNLFYRLKDMMNTIFDKLPENQFSGKEIWSAETETAFYNLQQNFSKDLEKAIESKSSV